ncbi:hypothetical protein DPMN_150675 [Dreissena polymorpha]|uniref:Uncharacterized protein n=1 Tax=Dreissena polymorpha TaxID=45954 RepID=A0A9D4FIF3_DREPO|nr:hypothetical protein DPMN_150675 [Dreissena polymorpha]
MLSGLAESPFFNCLMALPISSFVGMWLEWQIACSWRIPGEFAGAGMLSNSWKCSTHLFFCPSSSAITSPFLSPTVSLAWQTFLPIFW